MSQPLLMIARGRRLHLMRADEGPAMDYIARYLTEVSEIRLAPGRRRARPDGGGARAAARRGGRLFVLGVGGGSGTRPPRGLRFPQDRPGSTPPRRRRTSELTARINDEGWEGALAGALGSAARPRRRRPRLLVGGGSEEPPISTTIVEALRSPVRVGARILGVVGETAACTAHGGRLHRRPDPLAGHRDPLTESFQAIVWHLLVSHPRLRAHEMKWESTVPGG
jgi:D-sedoheptulose 7-phosphate isomerase